MTVVFLLAISVCVFVTGWSLLSRYHWKSLYKEAREHLSTADRDLFFTRDRLSKADSLLNKFEQVERAFREFQRDK